ncbi:hypothetical protein PGT21_031485 [Puccinia graminis f. sp. tritici]|uniref:Uncharacterized protein n=1 Tax=Puccinia graminis f. sp. tritici TaxID=56615 RepID=A0A5B0RRL7_PUCGR|nr:hypothetical protein PGT21_031485 [Puccinia graminis f. sp. tritici]KAA1127274.1 hypothetical protein PGTUg99_033595 [Puccinia graminis f. sp. tritici]
MGDAQKQIRLNTKDLSILVDFCLSRSGFQTFYLVGEALQDLRPASLWTERLSDSLMMSAEQGSYPELNSTPSGSRNHIHPRHLCAHRLRTCQREDAPLAHGITPCTLANFQGYRRSSHKRLLLPR